MQNKKIYTIHDSKLAMAYCEGFIHDNNALYSVENEKNGGHFAILNRFRSYEKGTKWGRFHCKCELATSSTLKIYALASEGQEEEAQKLNTYFHNHDIPWSEKKRLFERDGQLFVNCKDVLLYEMEGEYLWIAIEVEGQENSRVYDMRLDSQGDNFMLTFPEIYQEEGSFFHRYMSIFSSLYQDLTDEITNMEQYLDIETTPTPILKKISGWLGFETEGDFLDEKILRNLLKGIYRMNRIKGTKEVIRKLINIVLGEEPFIIERNRMEGYISSETKETYQKLFGMTMQDVTIIVKRPADEKLQSQMLYLLKQFKPVRSHIHLVFCQKCSNMDSYCFLDYNASLSQKELAYADNSNRMDGTAILQ